MAGIWEMGDGRGTAGRSPKRWMRAEHPVVVAVVVVVVVVGGVVVVVVIVVVVVVVDDLHSPSSEAPDRLERAPDRLLLEMQMHNFIMQIDSD